ncbi:hypothetical protein [Streptomyces sp. CB02923]|uniref:hypothetical protein n=1 Tax=Streptomyces sp. CB02923 TaxID=1718985 RepID=UPI001900E199|nr:hypothetical protein [Streptomyces sp. CB02923]
MSKLARLGALAQQFGYDYAYVKQGAGPRGDGYVMTLVPDPRPEARERATRNRARYPDAADGGALPPVAPEAVRLFKARIAYDLASRLTEKRMLWLAGVAFTLLAGAFAFRFRAHPTALVVAAVGWAVMMAVLPVGVFVNRRYKERNSAMLRAAGFAAVTDAEGKLRYVPPGGQLPGRVRALPRER